MRLPTRWLGYGLSNGARRASRNVTGHKMSAETIGRTDRVASARLPDHLARTSACHHPPARTLEAHQATLLGHKLLEGPAPA